MIVIEGLTKAYGDTCVVDDVSLTIPAGELTAIIGPNGAGKSTLLGLASRLITADRGRVLVDNLDVAETGSDIMARRLSVLRQENHVTARLRVSELVSFGRFPHSGGRLTSDDRGRIAHALAALELTALENRFLDELSGGQRQRAFVAMTLCQDAPYMLFDEPLASLDIRHAISMMELLRSAAGSSGKTVIVVLHDLNIAANFTDRVVAMKDGRIACQGTTGDVMTSRQLSELYGLPVQVDRNDRHFVVNYFNPAQTRQKLSADAG
jgi:iron complex transport system ATP-binding protein